MKKRLLALVLCAAFVLALSGCGGPGGEKGFTLQVIHGDGSEQTFQVITKKDTVGEALMDEGLVSGEQGAYGLFVQTVDGETADESQEQWWCLTKGGQSVNTGVDSTPVEADATYEFTLTVGY